MSTLAIRVSLPTILLAIFNQVCLAQIQQADTSETRYGAHVTADGWVHFVVYSPNSTEVNLLLFDTASAVTPTDRIPMVAHGADRKVKIKGTTTIGLRYMYEAKGTNEVSKDDQFGLMFNKAFVLNDPYAYQTDNVSESSFFSSTPFTDASASVYAGGGKSVVYDHSADVQPGHVEIKPEDLVVYELHVQDYTARIQSLDASKRGRYLGLAQSGLKTPGGLSAGLDHLVELGVNAVELMPVMEYDEDSGNQPGRFNHWGYMTSNFFAPETRYAVNPNNDIVELKQLVKALHDRKIAVFMDVVYNHTAEQTPWVQNGRLAAKYFNFNGLGSTDIYAPKDHGTRFADHTGAGNVVDFSGRNRFTKKLTTDSLALWYERYGIDGFRFDLAPILSNASDDAADWVDNDPRYDKAHLHAEPWGGGLWWAYMDTGPYNHQNNRWGKWLGKYRDNVRNFSKSTLRSRSTFKRLIEGYGTVPEGYPASSKPWRSVNFVSVHDGYTMRDCVYLNDNGDSHNCWDSGGDEDQRRVREKLLMGILLTSQGVPLILQGMEFGTTKSHASTEEGIRNSYNYESTNGDASVNNVNWLDWKLKDGDNSASPKGPTYGKELFNWTRQLIALRSKWSHFRRKDFPVYVEGVSSGSSNNGKFTYSWEGPADGSSTQLAVVWWGKEGEPDLMVVYNEDDQPFTVSNLADWSHGDWKILARSWFGDDFDFQTVDQWQTMCPDAGGAITLKGRTTAILISDND